MRRRDFVRSALVAAGAGALGCTGALHAAARRAGRTAPLYSISLAEWSLHRTIRRGELDPLDFPGHARERYGLDAVEYVNQFFMDRALDRAWLGELRTRAEDAGVRSLLIMCDQEGALGDPDAEGRSIAIENHRKWLDAAAFLGCHSIRVNAQSSGTRNEQARLAADGLRRLAEHADPLGLHVIVENHGGLSSDGEWLADVIRRAAHPRVGTLPDFGNFRVSADPEVWYDRYRGVRELMPFARAVSAKSHAFDDAGRETATDYHRMMRIVLDAGYRGYVGIEYEGSELSEHEGILATLRLLERVRDDLATEYAP
ncbi:MAG: sugar phosphate isomerase/epimerase [Gemmatimonadetes bacterium]|nr:sugar phosphate isomerase/epimerase [Gemmatimonadota bacterium]